MWVESSWMGLVALGAPESSFPLPCKDIMRSQQPTIHKRVHIWSPLLACPSSSSFKSLLKCHLLSEALSDLLNSFFPLPHHIILFWC